MLPNVLWALGAKKGNFENNPYHRGVDNRQGLWGDVWAQAGEKKRKKAAAAAAHLVERGWNLKHAK